MEKRSEEHPGLLVLRFREKNGLTQAALAAALGCSAAHVSGVENGLYAPRTMRLAMAYKRVVGIPPMAWVA